MLALHLQYCVINYEIRDNVLVVTSYRPHSQDLLSSRMNVANLKGSFIRENRLVMGEHRFMEIVCGLHFSSPSFVAHVTK